MVGTLRILSRAAARAPRERHGPRRLTGISPRPTDKRTPSQGMAKSAVSGLGHATIKRPARSGERERRRLCGQVERRALCTAALRPTTGPIEIPKPRVRATAAAQGPCSGFAGFQAVDRRSWDGRVTLLTDPEHPRGRRPWPRTRERVSSPRPPNSTASDTTRTIACQARASAVDPVGQVVPAVVATARGKTGREWAGSRVPTSKSVPHRPAP